MPVKRHSMHSVLACLLALLIMLPAGLPLAGAAAGADASSWLCGPSQTMSAQDKARLTDILTALGEIDKGDDSNESAMCLDCIQSGFACLETPQAEDADRQFSALASGFYVYDAGLFIFATGPPLGGRAPPHFL